MKEKINKMDFIKRYYSKDVIMKVRQTIEREKYNFYMIKFIQNML